MLVFWGIGLYQYILCTCFGEEGQPMHHFRKLWEVLDLTMLNATLLFGPILERNHALSHTQVVEKTSSSQT